MPSTTTPVSQASPAVVLFPQHQRVRDASRRSARARIHARVVYPIDTPRLLRDPLERHESRVDSTLTGVRLLVGALGIHGLILFSFALVGNAIGDSTETESPERLKIRIVEKPPPAVEPPPVREPEVAEAPIVPDFLPPKPPPPAKPKPKRAPSVAKTTVPPPTPKLAAPQVKAPRRRIVGLNMESTVAGNGPSFATGTSRMGRTKRRAKSPQLASLVPIPVAKKEDETSSPGPVQRVAARIPTRDVQFTKPQRSRIAKPTYPTTLKAQGIEGDVVVSVDLNALGRVTRVAVVRGSGHPAFDEAARKAALTEQFTPATRNGKPVAFTLTYSYRFRIED